MDLIVLNDGLYSLFPVTKQMLENIKLVGSIDCFGFFMSQLFIAHCAGPAARCGLCVFVCVCVCGDSPPRLVDRPCPNTFMFEIAV